MSERFNKLINDLQLHGKCYEKEEIIMKFMLTLPDNLVHKVATIRQGSNMAKTSLKPYLAF